MIEKRNVKIDILKGLGILFMVGGHAEFPLSKFVSMFHMAIFFMASGYFFDSSKVTSIFRLKNYIKKKIITLYIPFVIYLSLFELLHNVFLKLNILTTNELIQSLGGLNLSYDYWSFKHILKRIIKVFFMQNTGYLGGAFWFVRTLFLIYILYCIISCVTSQCKKKVYLTVNTTIALIFMAIGFILPNKFPEFKRILCYYSIFHLGWIIKYFNYSFLLDNLKTIIKIALFTIIYFSIYFLSKQTRINCASIEFENPLLLYLASILGWTFCYLLSTLIDNIGFFRLLFSKIGNYTMEILALHLLAFKLVAFIKIYYSNDDLYKLACFPCYNSKNGTWIFYIIAGCLLPTLLGMAINYLRTKFLNKITNKISSKITYILKLT